MDLTIAELWRYPVKSMQGELIQRSWVGPQGLLGDRAWALVDVATGLVASAKHPRLWLPLLQCRARFCAPPAPGQLLPAVEIGLPDGTLLRSDQPAVHARLSTYVGREVRLTATPPPTAERLSNRDPAAAEGAETLGREPLAPAAPGTFFDYAPVHLLALATLEHLAAVAATAVPAARLRPNLLIAGAARPWAENNWPGHACACGPELRLQVMDPAPRCVITALPQADLPRAPEVLRAIAANRAVSVTAAPGVEFPAVAGAYAQVLQPGWVSSGAPIRW